jgi:hypothetical protein
MDAATIKEWLGILAPYVMGFAGTAVAIWSSLRTQRRVDGRMDELEQLWIKRADARVAAIEASVLVPANVAVAAELVKSDARDAHDAAKS